MKYLVIIAAAIILIAAAGILFQRFRKPAGIAGWERVEKSSINENGFLLSGQAINYRDGRPYKLYMKIEGGMNVWYAEMQDTGEWYITDIGKNED